MPNVSTNLEIGDKGILRVWHPKGWAAEVRDDKENKWILVFVPPDDHKKQLPASEYVLTWTMATDVAVSAINEEQNIYLKSGMRLPYPQKQPIESELVFNYSSNGAALFVDPER